MHSTMHSNPVHSVIKIMLGLAALGATTLLASQTTAQTPTTFEPGSLSFEIEVNGPIDAVFPLFTPQGETRWIPGWSPEYIYPESGDPQPGALALAASHVKTDARTYWYTTVYDTNEYVAQHVNIDPGTLAMQVDIRCLPGSTADTTLVNVTFSYLPLSEAGNTFAQGQFSDGEALMTSWITLINYSLENGEPMPVNE